MIEQLQMQIHAGKTEPLLVYLPGLHGDCTLIPGFRKALNGRASLAEFTYPRRDDWSLDDYARAVMDCLTTHGVTRAWVIGESFSSQVAWTILGRSSGRGNGRGTDILFQPQGLILAGGFVRHPVPWGVRWAYWTSRRISMRTLRTICNVWARWVQRRSRPGPEAAAGIREFVIRRTNDQDRAAINSRYRLIAGNDPRPVARRTTEPVFFLSGLIDPIVPWPPVRRWLEQNCPGYRESRIIPGAGHAVLLDAPLESADQILAWIARMAAPAETTPAVTPSTPSAS